MRYTPVIISHTWSAVQYGQLVDISILEDLRFDGTYDKAKLTRMHNEGQLSADFILAMMLGQMLISCFTFEYTGMLELPLD